MRPDAEELGIFSRENQSQTRPLIQTYLDQFQEPATKKVAAKLEKRDARMDRQPLETVKRF